MQEAAIAALREWPRTGVPAQPRAWLTLTARRKAIDILRRENARAGKERDGAEVALSTLPPDGDDLPDDSVVRDDQLRLIFTGCHPALAPDARVALVLRTVCGLSVAQIAALLLTSEPAMAKRLTRTRQKITAARIPYRVPSEVELAGRLATVCGVIHACYTAGHAPLDGAGAFAVDACAEAVRLGRLVHDLLPDEAMPAAVLSLLLLTQARRPARVDAKGEIIVLADQDRSRWDRALIAEGCALLYTSLRRTGGIADPYQLQAAIAAQHGQAPSYRQTDWAEIVRLYDLLLGVAATPAAALARAVAVAEASGADAGLAALDPIAPSPRWYAVRAELLARQSRYLEAVEAVTASLDGDQTMAERRYRERRRETWVDEIRTANRAGS